MGALDEAACEKLWLIAGSNTPQPSMLHKGMFRPKFKTDKKSRM